jgi:hypothetical protein
MKAITSIGIVTGHMSRTELTRDLPQSINRIGIG